MEFDDFFEKLDCYMQGQGATISKKKLEAIKYKFKLYEMRITSKALKLQFGEVEKENPFSVFNYDVKVGNGPGGSSKSDDLPSDLIVGVTMGLCGLLLMVIPIPVVQSLWRANSRSWGNNGY